MLAVTTDATEHGEGENVRLSPLLKESRPSGLAMHAEGCQHRRLLDYTASVKDMSTLLHAADVS